MVVIQSVTSGNILLHSFVLSGFTWSIMYIRLSWTSVCAFPSPGVVFVTLVNIGMNRSCPNRLLNTADNNVDAPGVQPDLPLEKLAEVC